jgi:hypothetical protein
MTTAADHIALEFGPFLFGPAGMSILTRETTFQDWQACGAWLRGVERHIQFWVGDWVNYGRDRWGEAAEQGVASEAEVLAAEATGWKPATVEQYARVARQVAPERRDPDLPFSAHREVADRPAAEQGAWLARAKAENWSTDRLRGELRQATAAEPQPVWLVVRCRDEADREALRDRMAGEGREVKLP